MLMTFYFNVNRDELCNPSTSDGDRVSFWKYRLNYHRRFLDFARDDGSVVVDLKDAVFAADEAMVVKKS